MSTLPQNFKIVQGIKPTTTNGGSTAGYVSVKTGNWLWIIVNLTQAVGHATAITVKRATAVAGTAVTTLAADIQVWANEDTAATDTLVKQTDAKGFTVTNDVKGKQIVFGLDPSSLGEISSVVADCVTVTSADSSQATNFWEVTYLLDTKYKQATPPSAITD